MRRGARDDGDDERRAGEAAQLLGAAGLVQVWLVRETDVEREAAGALARLALEHDEPPGRELAVIGHARGDGQDRVRVRPASGRGRSSSAAEPSGGV